jgi:hypothetical protein
MCVLFSWSDGTYGKWEIGNVWCVIDTIWRGEMGN